MADFIQVGDQYVREDAITRLSHAGAAGIPLTQYYVHFADGGNVPVSEDEYKKLKDRFTSKRKKGAAA